jgi:3-dehydroquinate dehydratase-2
MSKQKYTFDCSKRTERVKLLIINGPNLNLLGTREPAVYGNTTFEDFLTELKTQLYGTHIDYFQSNHEGEIIDKLHQAASEKYEGIILNAGGYSHTSISIADAVSSITTPVVGVHISNIYKREQERHKELISQYVIGGIYGLGLTGYKLAVEYFTNQKT